MPHVLRQKINTKNKKKQVKNSRLLAFGPANQWRHLNAQLAIESRGFSIEFPSQTQLQSELVSWAAQTFISFKYLFVPTGGRRASGILMNLIEKVWLETTANSEQEQYPKVFYPGQN